MYEHIYLSLLQFRPCSKVSLLTAFLLTGHDCIAFDACANKEKKKRRERETARNPPSRHVSVGR